MAHLAFKLADESVVPRKRGKPPTGAVKGWVDDEKAFHAGAPKKGVVLTPLAPSKPKAPKAGPKAKSPARAATTPVSGLGGIEASLRQMVADEVAAQLEERIKRML